MPAGRGELRRSARLGTYDSNGRDFLADSIGWSRQNLEGWITCPTVRPHLQPWYQICIAGPRRFNDAVEWINSGERGYFYNPNDLEEDLLLMCLGEGDGRDGDGGYTGLFECESKAYADEKANTVKWILQELWARTAWRIAQANRGKGQAFEKYADKHPAACYGFVIDLLCLAFHSLAFRGAASVYASLINGNLAPASSHPTQTSMLEHEDDESSSTISDSSFNSETLDYSSNKDSIDDDVETPMTSVSSEEGEACVESVPYSAEDISQNGEFEAESMNLRLIDENGAPITGYIRAS